MYFFRGFCIAGVFMLCACGVTHFESAKPSIGAKPSIANAHSLNQELADWQHLKSPPTRKKDALTAPIKPLLTRRQVPRPTLISVQLLNLPVEQVLLELAHQAGMELHLHQRLTGNVTLANKNETIDVLLKRLSKQIPLYWRIEGSMLNVWGHQPYSESYSINYLNLDRTTHSRVGLATQVGTINALGDGLSGASNSSETSLENSANHHFWSSLATDLDGLVARDMNKLSASYTINRDAAMVTLHASPQLHHDFQNYLTELNSNAQRQVLIEATVVEVTLSKSFKAGIDWQLLSSGSTGVNAAQILSGSPLVTAESVQRIPAPNGLLSLVRNVSAGGITATLNLLQQFGDIKILSKPRIIAMNNQSSVLKVVDNKVYFTVNVERQRSEQKDEVITETEIHTVPIGLVMNVTPHIDDRGSVMLNVRPTLSRIIGFVDDPNPELASADVRNSVPEIQVREMESVLRVKSGHVAIIGGLMQEVYEKSDRTIPGVAKLPVFGRLFRHDANRRQQTELLIVLRPTVLQAHN